MLIENIANVLKTMMISFGINFKKSIKIQNSDSTKFGHLFLHHRKF